MPVILFVCTANRFRSPLAAAYTNRKLRIAGLPGTWIAASAGTWTELGLPAHPSAILAARSIGINLNTHRTREVNATLLAEADLIVVMESGQKEALGIEFPSCREGIALLGELAGKTNPEIPDPAGLDFADRDEVVKLIMDCIDISFPEIIRRSALPKNRDELHDIPG